MVDSVKDHEVIALFKRELHPLSAKLEEMLNEHYSHQTERRGCGYTQATRVMAEYINVPFELEDFNDLKLFEEYDRQALKVILSQGKANGLDLPQEWRNLDINPSVQAYLAQNKNDSLSDALRKEVHFQSTLRHLADQAELEESKIICQFIEDIILPKDAATYGLTELRQLPEKPKVGSCPMAEKFFLKIAHDQLLRQGLINIFVDAQGQPLMMEKINMGDNHSCVSLKPLMLNGVRLPVGSSFATDYPDDALEGRPNKKHKGRIIPIDQVEFWFLRITTISVSPENRKRAFTTHFKQQVASGLHNPDTTQVSQLIEVARQQL